MTNAANDGVRAFRANLEGVIVGETVVLYSSAIPDKWIDMNPGMGERKAAKLEAKGFKIDSYQAFYTKLDQLRDENLQIDRMIVQTHGNTGWIFFGGDSINTQAINALYGHNYSSMFTRDAHIFLHGCNIAEKGEYGDGREFLAAMARVFLSKNGGRVGASTSAGLMNYFWGTKTYHLWGKVVYASIAPGGVPRVYAGDELPGPIRSGQATGHWSVTLQDGSVEHYVFYHTGDISWDDEGMKGDSGKGTWSIVGGKLEIKWNSGGRESWDMPIYSELQTGVWTPVGGAPSKIEAELSSAANWITPPDLRR